MTDKQQESSKPSRDELAQNRTEFAYERTQMAATRTFFALLRTGFAIVGGGALVTSILACRLDQQLTQTALRAALKSTAPEIHHSNQGVQYAAYDYTDLLKDHGVLISMAAVGKAEENGYAERFMRTVKEEKVDLSEYLDFPDALSQIGRFIDHVYMTPAEFEAAWQVSQLVEASP